MTFSNKGEVNFVTLEESKDSVNINITKTMQVEQANDDEEMYDSDEEDEEYLKTLKTHGYYSVCANQKYLAFCKYESTQVYSYEFATGSIFKPVSLDSKNIYVTMMQMLSKDRLIVCYDSNKFLIHDLADKTLSKYSKQHMKSFPINYLNQYNRIYGVVELSESKLVLYTHFTHIMVDLNAKIPEHSKIVKNHPSKTDTRVMNWNETLAHHHKKYLSLLPYNNFSSNTAFEGQAETHSESENFKIENKYKGILFMDKLQDGTFVVVENLWKNLVSRLPDVLKVNKFGQ